MFLRYGQSKQCGVDSNIEFELFLSANTYIYNEVGKILGVTEAKPCQIVASATE
jgi:hypothetical protein